MTTRCEHVHVQSRTGLTKLYGDCCIGYTAYNCKGRGGFRNTRGGLLYHEPPKQVFLLLTVNLNAAHPYQYGVYCLGMIVRIDKDRSFCWGLETDLRHQHLSDGVDTLERSRRAKDGVQAVEASALHHGNLSIIAPLLLLVGL